MGFPHFSQETQWLRTWRTLTNGLAALKESTDKRPVCKNKAAAIPCNKEIAAAYIFISLSLNVPHGRPFHSFLHFRFHSFYHHLMQRQTVLRKGKADACKPKT